MHGLVMKGIQSFLIENYGPDVWAQVRIDAGLPFAGFEVMLSYPKETLTQVLVPAATALHKDESTLLEDLGTWLVTSSSIPAIRRLLRFGGATFHEFLLSLEELPGRAHMALPSLDIPEIEVTHVSGLTYRLELHWDVPGMVPLLLGILRAMADDYGALALLEAEATEADGKSEAIRVELLELEFAEGRTFQLGEAVP